MAVTPNYSWPIPVATDYVKDGWDAIADLGNAIDTTVAGLGGGLTHITTATITSQSTYDVTSCFSSTYNNYRIVFNATGASTSTEIRLQLLSNTTPSTTGYYAGMRGLNSSGGSADTSQANASFLFFAGIGSTDSTLTNIYTDISNPFLASNTSFNSVSSIFDGGTWFARAGAAVHISAASYNGFRLYATTGTFSGVIRVYGYQNS